MVSEEIIAEEPVEIENVSEEITLEEPVKVEEVSEEVKEEVKKEPKKISKPRMIHVKSDDIGIIYLKPENGSK